MGPMANGGTGGMGYRGMSNRVQGYGVYQQWGTGGMGYKGYGQWDTGGMGHMGNEAHWGVWVQGVWAMWAMGPMGDLLPKYQKDVKLSKRCQMSKNETPRLWRRFTKKLN